MTLRALLPVAGFTLWASAFIMLYAMLSVGCSLGWDDIELFGAVSLQRAQLTGIFLLHVLALAVLIVWLRRRAHSGFGEQLSFGLAIAALAASIFCFMWIFMLSTCA